MGVVDEDIVEQDELPDWLQEVEDEGAGEDLFGVEEGSEFGEDVIVADELPDWLAEVESDDEPFEPSEPSPQELEEVEADGELPDWLQETEEETELTEVVEVSEVLLEEEPEPEAEVEEIAPIVESEIDEESLPDWLQEPEEEPEAEVLPEPVTAIEPEPVVEEAEVSEPEPEPAPVAAVPPSGMPDWLKKLREGGDEEKPVVAAPPAPTIPTSPPEPRPVAQVVEEPEPEPVPETEEIELPSDADERLKMAQAARDEGDLSAAVRIYDSLVSSGVHLDTVIDDMELTIKTNPSNYALYQVMGDAMMKDGRLQSALEAYRNALDRLSN